MENNKNKKSVKFQGDMLNFCDFIQVFVFTRNHHLKYFNLTLVEMCDYKVKIISKQMFDILVILIFLHKVRTVSFR